MINDYPNLIHDKITHDMDDKFRKYVRIVKKKYNNGQVMYIGKERILSMPDLYRNDLNIIGHETDDPFIRIGAHYNYFRNGKVQSIIKYNDCGNIIYSKRFDSNGTLMREALYNSKGQCVEACENGRHGKSGYLDDVVR